MFLRTSQRVRRNTKESINKRIDQEIEARARYFSLRDKDEINKRIAELDKEWDIEKTLEANAGTIALFGVIAAYLFDRKWLVLPGLVTAFLVQHAIQGWCPPLPVFRKFGIRTKAEIDKEKIIMKIIRGDFKNIVSEDKNLTLADKAIKAVFREN